MCLPQVCFEHAVFISTRKPGFFILIPFRDIFCNVLYWELHSYVYYMYMKYTLYIFTFLIIEVISLQQMQVCNQK